MKKLIVLFTFLLSQSVFGQSDNFAGTYQEKTKQPTGEILEVVLKLKPDGTFLCTF